MRADYKHLILKPFALAESPTATELSGGLGPYLLQESKYSLFTKVAQKLTITRSSYAQGTAGWFAVSLAASILAGTAASA